MNISENDYQEIFNHSPLAQLILLADAPGYTVIDVNLAYLASTGTSRDALIGQSVFAVFPKSPTDQDAQNIKRSINSFNLAVSTKKPHILENYRYDIPLNSTGQFVEKYWTAINTPILDAQGNVKSLIHSPTDVTENFMLKQRENDNIDALRTQRKQLYAIFMQAPVGIAILRGPEYTVELINPSLAEIYGKPMGEMSGKPIFDTLTQAKGLGFEKQLDAVRTTGKPYLGKAIEFPLLRNGLLEKVYIDLAYVPFFEDDGSITAVIGVAIEVTSQVNAMHKLEEAEERARLAADAVNMGTYDLNILNQEMITSERFANIFGFEKPVPREEYVAVLHPEDHIIRQFAHREAIEKGIMMYEARVIWNDHSIHWIRVEGRVLYDKSGNPLRMLGTVIDVTNEKQDKELQKKLNTLVDHSVDLMSILDLKGINTYINAAGMELVGFNSMEEALQMPISALHPEEDYEFFKREVIPLVMETGDWAGNIKVKNYRSGEIIPVHNHYIRIDDPISAAPIAIGVVMRDLRPELQAKQALANSEHLLRNITSASPTALWMSDAQGDINYVNQTWLDWSTRSFEENLGKGWITAVDPEDRLMVTESFQESIKRRIAYEVEFRIPSPDRTRWCVAIGQPQYNKRQEFTGFIGSCTDITEHKELQAQKDNFIGIASHELKTPVTSLKGYTQVLERVLKNKGHEVEAGMMKKMDAQLNRLTSLIRDLLDVTKINSGKLVLNEEEFELQPVIKDLVEDLQRTTQHHTLVENISTGGKIYADKDRIEQVIINLITNAIKYSPTSEKIIIHCNQTEQEMVVCVEDFGVGISAENQHKVFEQFFRVSGDMQHTFPGMGLGLFISADIIHRAGGKIWVESAEGRGSRFYFSLPLRH